MTTQLNRADPTRGYRVEARTEEDGSWTVLVPDLPGCVSAGDSVDEAFANLPELIDLWIESANARGQLVPAPVGDEDYSGRFLLRTPSRLHGQLVRAARSDGVSLNAYCVTALAEVVNGRAGAELAVRVTKMISGQFHFSRVTHFGGGTVSREWLSGRPKTSPSWLQWTAKHEPHIRDRAEKAVAQ